MKIINLTVYLSIKAKRMRYRDCISEVANIWGTEKKKQLVI